jgi:hypothetical protein
MNCKQFTFLQEQGVDCLPISSLDIHQSLLLNGNHTPAKSLEKEQQTDGSPICTCGKEMSGCLIHPNTPDEWIAFMRVSLAKILASPEIRQGLAKKREAVYTVKSSASLGWFDPNTSTWKTSQQSFLTDSEQSLPIWPRSGMTRNGYVFELPIVARRTIGIGGGYSLFWPTPHANCHTGAGEHGTGGQNLQTAVEMWPTPQASDNRGRGNLSSGAVKRRMEKGKQISLSQSVSEVSGQLNPTWVEWLMGWPIGFTVSRHWATGKSRSKQRSPSNS